MKEGPKVLFRDKKLLSNFECIGFGYDPSDTRRCRLGKEVFYVLALSPGLVSSAPQRPQAGRASTIYITRRPSAGENRGGASDARRQRDKAREKGTKWRKRRGSGGGRDVRGAAKKERGDGRE